MKRPYEPGEDAGKPLTRSQKNLNKIHTDFWHRFVRITPNNFKYKSLSNWSLNHTVGCRHGCRFCYVPSASTIKQGPKLKEFGVGDPDAEWGDYVLVRPFDEKVFLASLRRAESTPLANLKSDGNRAVMLCTTTDPYQIIPNADLVKQKLLNGAARHAIRRSLELVRDHSTLNVRILTRSPLAREDFELMKSFGPRLLFGMSVPTLRDDLSKVYEPKAPSPSQRMQTLRAAKAAGLKVYVAIAPTYPECDRADMLATMKAIAELDPVTIFMEPINIRAKNVARIVEAAKVSQVTLNTEVFRTKMAWRKYAVGALKTAWEVAVELNIEDRVHLWPDHSLGSKRALGEVQDPEGYLEWLQRCWSRISEWSK